MDPDTNSLNDGDASDDDVDSEIFNVNSGGGTNNGIDEIEPTASRLSRSLRHIRNNKEAIKGSLRKAKESTKDKMFGTGRASQLKKALASDNTIVAPASSSAVEIESGVEMVEDMVVVMAASAAAAEKKVSYLYMLLPPSQGVCLAV